MAMSQQMVTGMRMEQRMKLAPRMIQSMEVLQLPLLALQEKIETELNSNPVLEQVEPTSEDTVEREETSTDSETEAIDSDEQELVIQDDSNNVEDFQRLDDMNDRFGDYFDRASSFRVRKSSGETDKKMEALRNTAALEKSLNEYLVEQWRLVEAEPNVKKSGDLILDYIDEKGYLTVHLEQLHNKDRHDFGMDVFHEALDRVQRLDPAGVGARNMKECFLIQMGQLPDDMSFEMRLVENHMDDLLENRLPQIAKKMKCSMDELNNAIMHLSKLDMSPGLQVGRVENHPITADITIESKEDGSGYDISLTDTHIPNLRVNNFYTVMSKDRKIDTKTREFLQQNIRSAHWLMDAIEQRKHTLLRVARSVVRYQREFFDRGQLYLKPLPMATVADEVGVHIATVSRAVSGKYVQCSQGILPLRGFFSGGLEDSDGTSHSWEAVRANLQQIVDGEDKSKPLSDDDIRKKLAEDNMQKIARRTVAKYRKLLNIPAARFRKKY